jgi:predicted O-linked N-acetylglucosamine transferase (SPINDLY family)
MHSNDINDAVQLHVAGRLDEAESVYRRILVTEPGNPNALHLLGVIAYQRKRYDEAADLINRAIASSKRVPEYRNNLGNVYLAQGRLDEAEACYRRALKLEPKYVDALNNLGNVFRDRGELEEAAASYRKALRFDSKRPEIHHHLGMTLEGLGRIDEAIHHYRESIHLKPDLCEAHSSLAGALKAQGKLLEAVESCSKALAINPAHARTLLSLGNAHSELGDLARGISCYREALRSQPDLCEAHLNLAHALREEGNKEEAALHFDRALSLKPNSLEARLGSCIGQIPLIHDSPEEIVSARQRYRAQLEAFSREIDLADPRVLRQASRLVGNCQPFFLAYQGENDRDLQSIYGNLITRIQSACFPACAAGKFMPASKPGERLRVGFVSGHYSLHSNWKIPIKGWVENLDRKDFELYGYYTRRKVDAHTVAARKAFDRFVEGVSSLEEWCELISRDRLHVLIFPEIGMDAMTVRMASVRLAPIQCTSWGHPDTSGLPTVDYFLSSDLMEPPDADGHYTEKLVRLPNLSIFYEPFQIEAAQVNRAHLGLREDAVVYLCAQSLFKYLPQYDDVFPRIALEVGDCQFAFLSFSKSLHLGERFVRRLEHAFACHGLRCGQYVKLLPHLDPPHYRALNEVADVFLDSIGWSGCNTTLEALSCDLPVVTLPGNLMRGRHTHAILSMMGVTETQARDLDQYVSQAAKLGTDATWRRHVSERSARLKERLYRDSACIRGLEDFLRQAVTSAS